MPARSLAAALLAAALAAPAALAQEAPRAPTPTATAEGEIEANVAELAREAALTPDQAAEVKRIVLAGQAELERLAREGKGPDDLARAAAAASESVHEQILAILAPDQRPKYAAWRERKLGEAKREGLEGHTDDPETAELAKALALTPEQTRRVEKIIADHQTEFERRVAEASRTGTGEEAMKAIEKIGEDVAKKANDAIAGVLTPEQREKFKARLDEQERLRKREEGH